MAPLVNVGLKSRLISIEDLFFLFNKFLVHYFGSVDSVSHFLHLKSFTLNSLAMFYELA